MRYSYGQEQKQNFILNKPAAMLRKLTEAETYYKSDNTLNIQEKRFPCFPIFPVLKYSDLPSAYLELRAPF